MIRLFAALEVPPEIGGGLARRQQGLPGAKWRPLDALHVTLRFFGEVAEPAAAELDAALAEIRVAPFDLELQTVGVFGDDDHMRAVWAGVARSDALVRLAARCEAAARQVGLSPEKRSYRPHVTLAYLTRHADPVRVAGWMQAHNLLHSPPWTASAFHLYSSWSGPDGSRYDLERSYPLSPEPRP